MEYGARSNAEHKLVWIGIFGAVGLLVMFVAYSFWPSVISSTSVMVGAKTFHAEVADTPEERSVGLSQLNVLNEDQALLVIYDYDNVWPIHTRGLKFTIDIAWLDKTKKVAYVAKNAIPDTKGMYRPAGKARYVLQLPAGAITKYGITVGRQVEFNYERGR